MKNPVCFLALLLTAYRSLSNNIDGNIFEEVYSKIIENDFLFEEKYMQPVMEMKI
ncbi:MAG: hypothetical protein LBK83_02390 [Treponema sp.]|nr:hypothetical protein [Treponema sp.]